MSDSDSSDEFEELSDESIEPEDEEEDEESDDTDLSGFIASDNSSSDVQSDDNAVKAGKNKKVERACYCHKCKRYIKGEDIFEKYGEMII